MIDISIKMATVLENLTMPDKSNNLMLFSGLKGPLHPLNPREEFA